MAVIKTNPEETQTIEGVEYGATISLILDRSNPGQGPRLHRHPYDETWLVLDGTVNFQAGNETRAAGPGDVVIVPSNTRTSSPTTVPAAQDSCASMPTPP